MAGVPTGRPIGRETKLTPEVQARIVEALRAGNYVEVACAYGGITRQTYSQWIAKSELPGPRQRAYAAFRAAAEKARSDAEIRNVAMIQRAAQDVRTWQAAAWWLERSFPSRWGRVNRTSLELSGPGGKPVQVTDARAALLDLLGVEADASPAPGDAADDSRET